MKNIKLTFLGGGSTVFARNLIGDCMCVEALRDSVFALYDIDARRLEESIFIRQQCWIHILQVNWILIRLKRW